MTKTDGFVKDDVKIRDDRFGLAKMGRITVGFVDRWKWVIGAVCCQCSNIGEKKKLKNYMIGTYAIIHIIFTQNIIQTKN